MGKHLEALFIFNIFKSKTDCCSIMDTVGLRVPTKHIRDFSTLNVSNVTRVSPSARSFMAANNIYKSLEIFNKHNISFEDTISIV
jgi:hypothetical protein